jgi:hypothetical protein
MRAEPGSRFWGGRVKRLPVPAKDVVQRAPTLRTLIHQRSYATRGSEMVLP